MAYVRQQQQEDEQVAENPLQQPGGTMQQGGQTQQQAQPVQLATTAGVAAGQPQQPTVQPQEQQQRRTGGVTNFGRILEANRPQAQALAGTLGEQYVGRNVENLRRMQDESLARLQEGVQAARPTYDIIEQGFQDPNAVLTDQELASQFRDVYGGVYGGPEGISDEDLAEYNRLYGTATEEGNIFQDEMMTRQELENLDERYSPGRTAFDMALLQADRGAQDVLKGYDEQLAQIAEQNREQFESLAEETVETGRTTAREMGERAQRQATQEVLPDFQDRISQRARDLQTQGIEQQQAIDMAIAQEQDLTDEQLQLLGITKEQYNALRDDPHLKLQNYLVGLDQLDTEIAPGMAATQEEYDFYQALNELIERDPEFLTDRSLVGTADTDFTEYLLDEAQLGKRALDIQRRALPTPEEADLGPEISNAQVGGTEPGDDRWPEEVAEEYSRLRDEYNIAPDAVFEVYRDDQIDQRMREGWTPLQKIDIPGRTDRIIFVRPGQSGTLMRTGTIDRLYDREATEWIEPGDIPLPVLYALMEEAGQLEGGQGDTVDLGGLLDGGQLSPEIQDAINNLGRISPRFANFR